MKNSIDYIDIIDGTIKELELTIEKVIAEDINWAYVQGELAVLKRLREIAQADIHEHHAEIADQLLKVRRVVEKM